MRTITLNTAAAGMTRLRNKGGANPETLFELTDAYVTASRSIKPRPAMVYKTKLPSASKGYAVYNGVRYTFAARSASNPGSATVLILVHPNPAFAGTISKIHFAHPFMGYLYVVAEFSDSNVYHYWLQRPSPWFANTVYDANAIVEPTTPNGLYFKAIIENPPLSWQPNHQYATNDTVQPTTYNKYGYTATNLTPSSPAPSGGTEPAWIAKEDALILESSAGGAATTDPPTTDLPPTPPTGLGDGGRYTNPGGSGGRLGQFNTPARIP